MASACLRMCSLSLPYILDRIIQLELSVCDAVHNSVRTQESYLASAQGVTGSICAVVRAWIWDSPRGKRLSLVSRSLCQAPGHTAASLQTLVNPIRLQPWEPRNKSHPAQWRLRGNPRKHIKILAQQGLKECN